MSTVPAAHAMPPPSVQDLGDGFYAYVQLDGSWGLNNCGIFTGERGVILVDTVFTVARARALASAVKDITSKPVQTVVNTHHHGDHTHGNSLFPGAAILGHDRCRQAVIRSGLEVTGWFPGVDWGSIEVRAPFITFADALAVYCDSIKADLRFMGPAHTDNDIVMWVEELGLLFAGDLVFNGGTPFVVMGSLSGLLRALRELAGYDIRTLVPGHGPVCGPEVIGDQIEYLTLVQQIAETAWKAGLSPLEAARRADLGRFANWTDPERLAGNLHRAYSELNDEPLGTALDYDSVVADMVAYNDGQPLRCLA